MLSLGENEELPHYCQVEVKIQAHYMVFINSIWVPCNHLEGMNALAFNSVSLTPHLCGMEGGWCYTWRHWETRLPTLPLLDKQGWCHCLFYGDSLQQSGYCVKVSHLPLSLSFHQKGQAFVGLLFLSEPSGVSRLLYSPATSLRYMRQKENPGNSSFCHSSSPKFPSLSAFLSLLSRMFVLQIMYNVQGFNCIQTEEQQKI